MVRYGADEIVQYAGEVPTGITFLVAGRVRLTVMTDDGTETAVTTLDEGSFFGLTTLTRQPNLGDAYALGEVTALEIGREHVEHLVMRKPLPLQNFGRVIDERRGKLSEAGHLARLDMPKG